MKNIIDEHRCKELEMDSPSDKITKSKYTGWYIELDEGFNVSINYCHKCGKKLE